jgi:hypothetical protein
MTAKEVIKEWATVNGSDPPWTDLQVIEVMKAYAAQKCREQRQLCNDARTLHMIRADFHNNILNAPEPKFD